jgi:hypothetical protein
MNWMYRGMGRGNLVNSVTRELGGFGGSPHIMVEWKEGSKDGKVGSWRGYAMTAWMGIVHISWSIRVCTIGVMGGMEAPLACSSLNDEWALICVMIHLVT